MWIGATACDSYKVMSRPVGPICSCGGCQHDACSPFFWQSCSNLAVADTVSLRDEGLVMTVPTTSSSYRRPSGIFAGVYDDVNGTVTYLAQLARIQRSLPILHQKLSHAFLYVVLRAAPTMPFLGSLSGCSCCTPISNSSQGSQ